MKSAFGFPPNQLLRAIKLRNVAQSGIQENPDKNYRFAQVAPDGLWTDDGIVMKNKALPKIGQRAFSLVELLVVIAVIAIIAAIAIPNIANITTQARTAKDIRNAQNIASVAAAAKAAGATNNLSTAALAIEALTANNGVGISVPQLGGQTLTFGVSTMTSDEIDGASDYLDDGATATDVVRYTPPAS